MAQKVFKHTEKHNGFEAAHKYTEKLMANGFKYSYTHSSGGKVYLHYELNLEVLVYVE